MRLSVMAFGAAMIMQLCFPSVLDVAYISGQWCLCIDVVDMGFIVNSMAYVWAMLMSVCVSCLQRLC